MRSQETVQNMGGKGIVKLSGVRAAILIMKAYDAVKGQMGIPFTDLKSDVLRCDGVDVVIGQTIAAESPSFSLPAATRWHSGQ
jgi:hypothetical protein